MHRHCIILISLLVLLAAPLSGQPAVIDTTTGRKPDTVSVEEMKQNFYDWLHGIPARPEPTSERFLTDTPLFQVIESDADARRDEFYMDSPRLRELASAISPNLPPSYWWPLTVRSSDGKTTQTILRWLGPRAYYSRGVDNARLVKDVEQQYENRATWFSGPVCLTASARLYCNNWLTRYAKVFEVERGQFVSGPYEVHDRQGAYSRQTTSVRVLGVTDWDTEYGEREIARFAQDLRRQLGPDSVITARGTTGTYSHLDAAPSEYSFLLTTDACGKAHLHLLWPKQLSTAGWEQARRLVEAVEAMPAGGFGHFVTTDGRIFPGRYLKFCYRSKWTVEEYLYQTRKPVNAPRKEPTARRLLNELDRLLYP